MHRIVRHTTILILTVLSCHVSAQSVSEKALEAGRQFIQGIGLADFREMPLDEIMPLSWIALPRPVLAGQGNHPSLLFKSHQQPSILARRYQQPYENWAEQILMSASLAPASNLPLQTEVVRSRSAKLHAFAWFISRERRHYQAAVEALRNMEEIDALSSFEGGTAGRGWGDWMEAAEAVTQYAVALDLLWHDCPPSVLQRSRRILAEQVRQMVEHRLLIPKNNHAVAIGAGIGTAALLIRGGEAQHWLDIAMELLRSGLAKIETDGSYREGVYYGRFVASRLYPFAYYLYNVTGINLLRQHRIECFNQWLNDTTRPDGSAPMFDDAFPERLIYQPIAAALLRESHETVRLIEAHHDRPFSGDDAWVEAFCAYRPAATKATQSRSARFYPEGGMALFKGASVFGLLLGEPGRPHLSGHDHIDATAFSLFAFGEEMLLDSGYGPGGVEDVNRVWYTSVKAHNVPLVNGLGPHQNPLSGDELGGQLLDAFETEGLASACVRASYRGSHVKRRVWSLHNRYFIVDDELQSAQVQRFTIPWHGRGKLEKKDLRSWKWQQERTSLEAYFIDSHLMMSPEISIYQGLDTGAGERHHETAAVYFEPATEAGLISLFVPQSAEADQVRVVPAAVLSEKPAAGRIITGDGWSDLLVTARGAWQCSGVESDASLLLLSRPLDDKPPRIIAVDVTTLKVAGEMVFESLHPVTLALIQDAAGWYGYISQSGQDQGNVQIFFPPVMPHAVHVGGALVPFEQGEDGVMIRQSLSGRFELGTVRFELRSPEPSKPSMSMLSRLRTLCLNQGMPIAETEAELTCLNNEIMLQMGETLTAAADTIWGGGKSAALLRLMSGVANSLYGQTGSAAFRLPQQFSQSLNLWGQTLNYYEEGLLHSGGITPQYQSLTVNDRLYLTTDRFFDGHRAWQAAFTNGPLRMRVHHSETDENFTSSAYAAWYLNPGLVSLAWADGTSSDRMLRLNLQRGGWSGSVQQREQHQQYDVMLGRQSALFRSLLEVSSAASVLRSIQWAHSQHFGRHWGMSAVMQGFRKDASGSWDYAGDSQLWFTGRDISGLASVACDSGGVFSGYWQTAARHRRWQLHSRGQWGKERDYALVSAACKFSHFTWQQIWDSSHRLTARGIYHGRQGWQGHLRLTVNTEQGQYSEQGLGGYLTSSILVGGELFRIVQPLRRDRFGINFQWAQFWGPLGMLDLSSRLLWDDGGDVEYFQLSLHHRGAQSSPGILLESEAGRLSRLEGYVQFVF